MEKQEVTEIIEKEEPKDTVETPQINSNEQQKETPKAEISLESVPAVWME